MSDTASDDRNVEIEGRNSDDSDDPDNHDPRPRKVSTNKQGPFFISFFFSWQ